MTVYFVGAGPGDPRWLTVAAAALLRSADVVVSDSSLPAMLLGEMRADAERIDVEVPSEAVTAAVTPVNLETARVLVDRGRDGDVVRLVPGTPLDSPAVRAEAALLRDAGVPIEVVPGVAARRDESSALPPLFGHSIVNPRSRHQASELSERLVALGASVIEVPAITIADPLDGGDALAAAVDDLDRYDWVVLTSPNGARRFCEAVGDARRLRGVRIAAIGPGTAAVLAERFLTADLVPDRYVAESLLAAFPEGPGRVLLARAAVARDVLPEGLASAGWDVDVVEAYRTVAARPTSHQLAAIGAAEVVAFTSSSTVSRLVDAVGRDAVPRVVAAIGPITAATARGAGLDVAIEATEHSIDGLVAAIVAWAQA